MIIYLVGLVNTIDKSVKLYYIGEDKQHSDNIRQSLVTQYPNSGSFLKELETNILFNPGIELCLIN